MSALSASTSQFVRGITLPTRQTARVQRTVVSKTIKATSDEDWAKVFCLGAGSTAPFERFDPAGMLSKEPASTMIRYREAELTHGRVAMLASVGMLVGEKFNPLFDGAITGPAINQFQQVPENFWLPLTFVIAIAELYRARLGWKPPAGGDLFTCKDDYTPGSLGYDPLGLKPDNETEFIEMQNKELNNGRLAMIGVAGMVVQELITQETVW